MPNPPRARGPRPQPPGATDEPSATTPGKRGRRRDPSIDARVSQTVIEVYAQLGWAGLSFDEVARRARVGKAALYLRWPTKEDLLLDSMMNVGADRVEQHPLDFREYLAQIGRSMLSFYSSTAGLAYLRLYVESRYVPGLEERWRKQQATPLFLDTRARVRAAIAAGELPPGASPTIVIDVMAGAIANHVLSTPPELFPQMVARSASYLEALVEFVLAAARSTEPTGRRDRSGRRG